MFLTVLSQNFLTIRCFHCSRMVVGSLHKYTFLTFLLWIVYCWEKGSEVESQMRNSYPFIKPFKLFACCQHIEPDLLYVRMKFLYEAIGVWKWIYPDLTCKRSTCMLLNSVVMTLTQCQLVLHQRSATYSRYSVFEMRKLVDFVSLKL